MLDKHRGDGAAAEYSSLQQTCGRGSTLHPAMLGWKPPGESQSGSSSLPITGTCCSNCPKCSSAMAVSGCSLQKVIFIFCLAQKELTL